MQRWLLLLLLLSAGIAQAQMGVRYDTAAVQVRTVSRQTINAYKADKAFAYDKLREPALSLWDRFWMWFWFKVNQIFATPGGKTTMGVLFIVFGVSMIVFFALKVTGMNKNGLFNRGNNALAYSTSAENIHQINFDEEIAAAIEAANYRLAIRLLYLQALKRLSDLNLIEWQLNKTNTDYLNEVKDKAWHPAFQQLTANFEYTWYGETPVEQERFSVVQQQFTQFNKQL